MRLVTGFVFSLFVLLAAAPSVAEPTSVSQSDNSRLTIQEWKVPWEGRPRDPFVDNKGRVCFCGQAGNYIAYLEPLTGRFERYELADDTHPHNLIVDSQGSVWYAGNANAILVN